MKGANAAARFLLEVAALASLGYWGFQASDSTPAKVALGLGAPLIGATVWGLLIAPRARRRLPDPTRLVVEPCLFASAAGALAAAGQIEVAIAFAAAVAVSVTLMFVLGQRGDI